jgi:MEMO1 family protein
MAVRQSLALALVAALCLGAGAVVRLRPAVNAGTYYPSDGQQLLAAVRQYMDQAEFTPSPNRLTAIVVPPGPYHLTGPIAAPAFRAIDPGEYDKVLILAPSHFASFRGASIAAVQYYETPLGPVPLDAPTVRKMDRSTLIRLWSIRYTQDARREKPRTTIHEFEYAIESQLPFLQARLNRFQIVPVVVGQFEGYGKDKYGLPAHDEDALKALAERLREVIDERTLIVAVVSLTHYGQMYGNVPFTENIEAGIEQLDREAMELLLLRDYRGFHDYVQRSRNRLDGVYVLKLLLRLLPRQTEGALLAYDTTARITGVTDASVSYASLAYYDMSRSARLEGAEALEPTTVAVPASPGEHDGS